MKSALPLTILLMFGIWIVTYGVKQKVVNLEERLTAIHHDSFKTAESVQILNAEWSYLNNPARLQSLATKYLKMVPCQGKQLVCYGQIENMVSKQAETIRNIRFKK